jgi:glutamate synthase (NADPH/NADH)
MAKEGIEFRTNVEVGKDIDSSSFFREYDAILLATGATWPRDLNIPSKQ